MTGELRLARLPRDEPLQIKERPTGFTCAICDARQEPYTWRVILPQRAGSACVHCAADRGFTVIDAGPPSPAECLKKFGYKQR